MGNVVRIVWYIEDSDHYAFIGRRVLSQMTMFQVIIHKVNCTLVALLQAYKDFSSSNRIVVENVVVRFAS